MAPGRRRQRQAAVLAVLVVLGCWACTSEAASEIEQKGGRGIGITIAPATPPATVVKLVPPSAKAAESKTYTLPKAAIPPESEETISTTKTTETTTTVTTTTTTVTTVPVPAPAAVPAKVPVTVAPVAAAPVAVAPAVVPAPAAPQQEVVLVTDEQTFVYTSPEDEGTAAEAETETEQEGKSTPAPAPVPAAKPATRSSFVVVTKPAATPSPQPSVVAVKPSVPAAAAPKPASPTAPAPAAGGNPILQPAFARPPSTPSPASAVAPSKDVDSTPSQYSNATVPPPWIFKQKGATKMVKIGCAVPFEGSQQAVGQAVMWAIKMAITQLAPKELPNYNVNMTCLNSRCSDIPAYMATTRFADEGAAVVIGEICSPASVAAAGVANARKLPTISPASSSPSLSEIDYFFRTVPSDRFQGVAAANLIYSRGGRNVGLVYEDNAYGYGLAFNFIAGFTKNGGSVPVVYQFRPGMGNPKEAVAQMKAGQKDKKLDSVFISTNNLTFASDFLVAAKAANLTLRIYGGDALSDSTLFTNLQGRPSVLGNVIATSLSPGTVDFVKEFLKFSNGVSYQAYAAHAYDAVDAFFKAYKAAAAPKNGTDIVEQLNKTNFTGVTGPVVFDKYGDLIPDNKTYAYITFNATTGNRTLQGFISK